jgi:hypothetical protein
MVCNTARYCFQDKSMFSRVLARAGKRLSNFTKTFSGASHVNRIYLFFIRHMRNARSNDERKKSPTIFPSAYTVEKFWCKDDA